MKKLCFNKVKKKSQYESSIFNEDHQELVPAEERMGDKEPRFQRDKLRGTVPQSGSGQGGECNTKPRMINDLRGF
jgi:hypothetical protein